jgi:hypothetical protein
LTSAERSVLSASNAFSFALWKRVNAAEKDSNVFVSPLSIFSLGGVNGAANQTLVHCRVDSRRWPTSTPLPSLIALLTSLHPR